MSEGLSKYNELKAEGYDIIKIRDTPEGKMRCILANSSGVKKVIDLSPDEYQAVTSGKGW